MLRYAENPNLRKWLEVTCF